MRFFLVRHAETVFNAAHRMQGNNVHSPLSRRGLAQADGIGRSLAAELQGSELDIWSADTGRALQTASIIVEHLGRSFFSIRIDARLRELDIGRWAGRFYKDIVAEQGPILCPDRRTFVARPPGGEWYPQVAERLRSWIKDLTPGRDTLVVSHGITLRVLRSTLLNDSTGHEVCLADEVPQGDVVKIEVSEDRVV